MQSVAILPESIDNLDILEDVLPADDSIMDLVEDSDRRLSLISLGTSLMNVDEDDEDEGSPIALTTTTTGSTGFGESSSSLPQPHRHRVVSLEGQVLDERQRCYFALESNYQNSSACSIDHILPEPEKVDRPDWSTMRPRQQKKNDVEMMMIPSPFKKLPKSQEHSPTKTTIISAFRHAYAAAAAAADSSDEMFMSSAEFAEYCNEFSLFDSSNSSGSIENNSNNINPLNKSSDKLFSTGELATLCSDFPSLLSGKANSSSTPTTAPSSSSSAPLQAVMPMFTSSNMMDEYDSNILSMSDLSATHPTSTTPTQVQQPEPQEQQQQPQVELHDENTDVVVPTRFDVKCGRGGDTIQHNLHFIDLCEAMAEAYAATNKRGMDGKQGIVMGIVNAIAARQGRFIKQECISAAHQWQVLPLQGAIDKTSHCIRDILKRRKNEQQQQQQQTA